MKTVRIGAGQGFYGDTHTAALDMAEGGDVSFMCFDALSELTLAILQKDRQRDPSVGYARDLLAQMKVVLPAARRRGIQLVTNAGGLNPKGASEALATLARSLGLGGLRIGCVSGDDMLGRLDEVAAADRSAFDGRPSLERIRERVVFGCAYLGARPIVEALERGCDVVVTGRVADSALFLAPAVHALGWGWEDWDRLAVGTMMGHLLECSGQATGGNFSGDWQSVPEPWRLGYPLAEVSEDGSLRVSKPVGTGGMVTCETVSEQLLYEIQDPSAYRVPDVVVDLRETSLQQVDRDVVSVNGVRGRKRPETLKVLLGYSDGWMGEGRVGYTWPRAYEKAQRAAEILRERIRMAGVSAQEIVVEYQGRNSLFGAIAPPPPYDAEEVYLRVAVRTASRAEAEKMTREVPYLGLNGPPGVSGYGGITPPRELLGIWPALVARELVERHVQVEVIEA